MLKEDTRDIVLVCIGIIILTGLIELTYQILN